jgi:DNA-binding response OmpR family regulator
LTSLRAARNKTPVLVLTAIGATHKKIELLNLGADDYLAKPFDLGELIARCRALIRRGKGVGEGVLTFGSIKLNLAEQRVFCGGRPIDLSRTEYRILEYLIHRPRTVVSKKELLEHLYDFTWKHHSNVIEAHVSNLRKKLRHSDQGSDVLETLRGRGYRFAESSAE